VGRLLRGGDPNLYSDKEAWGMTTDVVIFFPGLSIEGVY